MTATACSPRSAAARCASTPGAASTGPTSSSRWSGRFSTCRLSSALIDGEVAVAGKDGHTDFGALQDRIAEGKGRGIGYYVFDLL